MEENILYERYKELREKIKNTLDDLTAEEHALDDYMELSERGRKILRQFAEEENNIEIMDELNLIEENLNYYKKPLSDLEEDREDYLNQKN